jgi:hypothetical protein
VFSSLASIIPGGQLPYAVVLIIDNPNPEVRMPSEEERFTPREPMAEANPEYEKALEELRAEYNILRLKALGLEVPFVPNPIFINQQQIEDFKKFRDDNDDHPRGTILDPQAIASFVLGAPQRDVLLIVDAIGKGYWEKYGGPMFGPNAVPVVDTPQAPPSISDIFPRTKLDPDESLETFEFPCLDLVDNEPIVIKRPKRSGATNAPPPAAEDA